MIQISIPIHEQKIYIILCNTLLRIFLFYNSCPPTPLLHFSLFHFPKSALFSSCSIEFCHLIVDHCILCAETLFCFDLLVMDSWDVFKIILLMPYLVLSSFCVPPLINFALKNHSIFAYYLFIIPLLPPFKTPKLSFVTNSVFN